MQTIRDIVKFFEPKWFLTSPALGDLPLPGGQSYPLVGFGFTPEFHEIWNESRFPIELAPGKTANKYAKELLVGMVTNPSPQISKATGLMGTIYKTEGYNSSAYLNQIEKLVKALDEKGITGASKDALLTAAIRSPYDIIEGRTHFNVITNEYIPEAGKILERFQKDVGDKVKKLNIDIDFPRYITTDTHTFGPRKGAISVGTDLHPARFAAAFGEAAGKTKHPILLGAVLPGFGLANKYLLAGVPAAYFVGGEVAKLIPGVWDDYAVKGVLEWGPELYLATALAKSAPGLYGHFKGMKYTSNPNTKAVLKANIIRNLGKLGLAYAGLAALRALRKGTEEEQIEKKSSAVPAPPPVPDYGPVIRESLKIGAKQGIVRALKEFAHVAKALGMGTLALAPIAAAGYYEYRKDKKRLEQLEKQKRARKREIERLRKLLMSRRYGLPDYILDPEGLDLAMEGYGYVT